MPSRRDDRAYSVLQLLRGSLRWQDARSADLALVKGSWTGSALCGAYPQSSARFWNTCAGCSSMKSRTTSVGEIGFVLWCPTGRSHCYTTLPAHSCLWSDRLWAVTVLSIRLAPLLLHLKRETTRYRTATTGGVPPRLGQRPKESKSRICSVMSRG
ncbi:hypothetical protein DFH08DRAFT_36153 [Mycena albidolilacea]|uniref:Uncharacterized protein n=1 Tax=Mycena albidolilacea TaxID=1033008 RepID=A0AAD7AWE1_9AGAR|nr:hypothetical protein DFH08DRAFT_36153 [Mycena albidolilacea]